ncbi:MAG: glycosyltransferase [Candidatus Brocadia sp.]|uniref:Glycosyltransferase fused to TPR-repeat domain protein n=1 Tax=Candidatus Brocadia fulgida TaxID=380242 RepID=A0A0M2UUQ6_9BACT|nr:MAG: glycosyltransferase fused to TPR-repeat domain protein [Candidatus Brocadia fulgida]UJS21733.1 MAG: glycosyltransferase [Candidatus Brocadia sp.]
MKKSQHQKISACLIVKNEEELLPNCLSSIKNTVDEIIIVDTGSTDSTVTIAKDFGAKVYHHPWNDSFSEARNHCLKYASGNWIFQIDADEELEQADIMKLQKAINNVKCNAIAVAIHSAIQDNYHTFYNIRIFRRGKGFYQGIIHEQLIIDGDRLSADIRLYHHGYNLDPHKMKEKWQKTTRLLQKQLEQNKYDSFAWFNLIRNYRTQELFNDGIIAGEKALTLFTPDPGTIHPEMGITMHHYAMIVYETANCYLHLASASRAKELCYKALSKLEAAGNTPENIDILFTLACAYLKEGSYQKAVQYFHRFLSLREWHLNNVGTNTFMTDTLGYDYAAHNGIGYCLGNLGQWGIAIDHLEKAIALNPRYRNAYYNLALCFENTGDINNAVNTLLRTVSEDIADDAVWLHLGELYIQQNTYEKALPYFEKYLKNHPADKNVLLKIVWCYEKLGHLEAALIGYRSVEALKEPA